jgi:hypothetical protein
MPDFKPIDPKFIVADKELFQFHIRSVLNGLVNTTVLGTGWKTQKRNLPSFATLVDNHFVIYDPSEN